MSVEEILPLLKSDVSLEDEIQREVVSDEMLDKLLNRDHLISKPMSSKLPYPQQAPGYEVVIKGEESSLLPNIDTA